MRRNVDTEHGRTEENYEDMAHGYWASLLQITTNWKVLMGEEEKEQKKSFEIDNPKIGEKNLYLVDKVRACCILRQHPDSKSEHRPSVT